MSHGDDLGHGDIEAALAARRELGARYDAELVDGFAERIERAVERRAAERGELQQRRTAGRGRAGSASSPSASSRWWRCIPISIVLVVATDDGFLALLVALAGHRRRSTPHTRGSPRRD